MDKKNLPLILGLMVPVLMIVLVMAVIYLPAMFYKPKQNFVYSASNYYERTYEVMNGRVTEVTTKKSEFYSNNNYYSKLYLYDFATNSSRELTLNEARSYTLDSNRISPDGFEIKDESSSRDYFLFFSSYDDRALYVKGHGINKKLNTPGNDNRYGYGHQFHFLGWVQ